MTKWLLLSVGGVALLAAAGIGSVMVMKLTEHKPPDVNSLTNSASLIDANKLNSLDQLSNSSIDSSRLDGSLTPPTNKWYSGMVLAAQPQPGFNIPNSILPKSDGFELGLPHITSSADGIYGPHTSGIQLVVKNASSYKLTRYDELTLTLSYYDGAGTSLFDVTFASGSPYGYITVKSDIEVALRGGTVDEQPEGFTVFKNGESWYGAKASNGKTGQSLRLAKGDNLTLFSANQESDMSQLAALSLHRVQSGEVSYEVIGNKVKTKLSYKTIDNKPTILVRMPHQQNEQNKNSAITYRSLYGDIDGYKTNTIEYSQPIQPLEWSLPLDTVSDTNKDGLNAQLKTDIENSMLDKKDTYFGGKQLQRLAQLVMIADAIGEDTQRDAALAKLKPALAAWFDEQADRSFYYDKTAKTIVGREASFGSDKELNDHHFHYAYFIYAASVAAKFDDEFLNKYENDVNLLVADIANYKTKQPLQLRRSFDAYAGHSWASGFANYKDGNNQESSSEAVNAWTATGLWADVTKNKSLKHESAWLLANEVASAKEYWLTVPAAESYLSNFSSPLVSINWGGKREYKTFFSDEANAKLAIQLLPLNPTMQQYISQLPAAVFKGSTVKKPYGDYIYMAQSSKNKFEEAIDYPNSLIDDGNSKAYLMAYALSR